MASVKKYKALLVKAAEMRGQSGSAIYERTKILMQVFADMDFRADVGELDDEAAAKILTDDYLGDTHWEFLELRAMYEFAPDRSQWGQGNLRQLWQAMNDHHAAQRVKSDKPITRARATVADLEKLRDEAKHEKSRRVFVEDELKTREATNAELSAEIRALQIENAELKGRISELERALSRELAAA